MSGLPPGPPLRATGLLLALAALLPACGGGSSSGGPSWTAGVVFVADRDVPGKRELYLADLSGGGARNITGGMIPEGDVTSFAWSPDRNWIAFLADRDVDG